MKRYNLLMPLMFFVILFLIAMIAFVLFYNSRQDVITPQSIPSRPSATSYFNITIKPTDILTVSQMPTTVKITDVIPTEGTGFSDLVLPSERVQQINSRFELKKMLPLSTGYFLLDYDYKNDYFTVFYPDGKTVGEQKLKEFLEENKFSSIPLSEFVEKK